MACFLWGFHDMDQEISHTEIGIFLGILEHYYYYNKTRIFTRNKTLH